MALSPARIAELQAQRDAKSGNAKETPEARALREMGLHKQAQADLLESMGPVEKMLAGHGGDLVDMGRKARQLYNLGIKATPWGGAEEDAALQETYAQEREKRDMQAKGMGDSGWMTAGRVAGAVLPAIGAIATAPAAGAAAGGGSLLRSLGLAVPAGVVEGNLSRPMVESEANWGTQLGDAAVDAAFAAVPTALGEAYQGFRKARHAMNRTQPDAALSAFAHAQGGAARPIPNAVPGMPLKSAAQENVAAQVEQAVKTAKAKATKFYQAAGKEAGSRDIRLNSLFAEGQLPPDLAKKLSQTKNPILRRLSGATTEGSTSAIVGAKGEALAGGATMNDLIDARKTLSKVKRDLLSAADPDSVAAANIDKMLAAADTDLAQWAAKSPANKKANDLYEQGRALYRNEVVPLTSRDTIAGKFYKGGDTPENRARSLLGPDAGPSVFRLNAQNPEVVPALRQQHAQLLLDAQGVPQVQAKLLREGSAVENLYPPDQLNWMRSTADALRAKPSWSPLQIASRALIRREPVATGSMSSALQNMLSGVDAYGDKAFADTSSPLLRAILGGELAKQMNQSE